MKKRETLPAQGPVDVNVRLSALEAENAELKAELAALQTSAHTNGDRIMTMDMRVFTVDGDGYIQDNNFDFDAGLLITGDFVNEEKNQYTQMIANALNGHNA